MSSVGPRRAERTPSTGRLIDGAVGASLTTLFLQPCVLQDFFIIVIHQRALTFEELLVNLCHKCPGAVCPLWWPAGCRPPCGSGDEALHAGGAGPYGGPSAGCHWLSGARSQPGGTALANGPVTDPSPDPPPLRPRPPRPPPRWR